MTQYRIFPDQLTKKNIESLDTIPLAYVKYLIGFACARTEGFNIITVQARFAKTDPWSIIWSNEPSNQGQATNLLGHYNPGKTISIFWVLRSVTKISSVAAYIIKDDPRLIQRVAPKTPPKKMERGEDWGEEITDFNLF